MKLPVLFVVGMAACAKVTALEESADAGPSLPAVTAIEPQPGVVPGNSQFVVHFSEPMDEGQLLAASGRSETVVLAAEADVERAAAAIEHSQLSAHERTLLIPAEPDIAADRKSITLGLEANYLNKWDLDVSYTNYFGGGQFNLLSDRDFVAFVAKYSF